MNISAAIMDYLYLELIVNYILLGIWHKGMDVGVATTASGLLFAKHHPFFFEQPISVKD